MSPALYVTLGFVVGAVLGVMAASLMIATAEASRAAEECSGMDAEQAAEFSRAISDALEKPQQNALIGFFVPDWEFAKAKFEAGEEDPLDVLVYNNEPAGRVAAQEFRDQVQAVLDWARDATETAVRRKLQLETADNALSVPVWKNFETGSVIGVLTLAHDALPPTGNFVFSPAIFIENPCEQYKAGEVPRSQYDGPYKLQGVGLISDDNYLGYLRQIGKIGIGDRDPHDYLPGADPSIKQLKDFYNVETAVGLVAQMESHIERLQGKLKEVRPNSVVDWPSPRAG